mmetsp:Transcript_54649/g.122913  ORF Transcript_54649/g.122913 Transcript_54649/m.122913 type:complete len:111 (-) Transcript_54649:58-390(-)
MASPKPRGEFHCSVCAFRCRYDYYGREPPQEHHRKRWLEDIFALQNPSPVEFGGVRTICLGALCSVCREPTCVGEACSLFYGQRFCKRCAVDARKFFPPGLEKQLHRLLD